MRSKSADHVHLRSALPHPHILNLSFRFCGWVDVGLSKLGEREAETAGEALLASGLRFPFDKNAIHKHLPENLSCTCLPTFITMTAVKIHPSANYDDQADDSIHLAADAGGNDP